MEAESRHYHEVDQKQDSKENENGKLDE